MVPFLEPRLVRSLGSAKEALQGLVCIDGKIWTASGESSSIKKLQKNEAGVFASVEEIEHGLENIRGLTWTGSEFMVSDNATKTVYEINPVEKTRSLYLNLMKLESKVIVSGLEEEGINLSDIVTPILNAEGTNISAIAFNKGKLWITVQAGYSSSILAIDDESRELVNSFYARGPDPVGITFEADGEKAWVLDGSNKELSQFDMSYNWTQAVLKVPLKKPFGLALDQEGNFIVADLATNEIHLLTRGGVEWKNTQS